LGDLVEPDVEPVKGGGGGHGCQTSPQSPHSSAYSSTRSLVVMRVSVMAPVFWQDGQVMAGVVWAVKSAGVANPVSPMQAAQRQYPEVEG
jgi:hypothetical protein